MWFPGYHQAYNVVMDNSITFALGKSLSRNTFEDSVQHSRGYDNARFDNVITETLDIHPRLQTQAIRGLQSNPFVVTAPGQKGAP